MWNVIGHERTVAALSVAVEERRVPHALLLTGPSGTGKTRMAIELAKAMNCLGDPVPCQACLHCRQIEAGMHPDVVVIDRLEGKGSILIEQVRELRDTANLRAFQARFKVYIISGAEALTDQASDALLKTLEEPQPQVVMILTAVDMDGLKSTIISRCRVMPLQSVRAPAIARALEGTGLEREQAERLARLSQGDVGWSLSAARQPKLGEDREALVARLSGVLDMNLEERLTLVESLTGEKRDRAAIRRHLEMFLLLGRDLLLMAQGLPAQTVSGPDRQRLVAQASRLNLGQIHSYLQKLRQAMDRIDSNVDPRLTLEALLADLP